jgi:trans-aconitate methyltransferase
MDDDRYYSAFAAAWVRGAHPTLAVADDDEATIAAALAASLRVHRFKKSAVLPRVQRVLGLLRGFAPETLLDVGSGRGAFLWPLLETLPTIEVTSIDVLPHRVEMIDAVARGGTPRLTARLADVATLTEQDQWDVVTILEVLEHLPDPARAATALLRAARRAVIATVPSKEDDNPEHIHLFDRGRLIALFEAAGARRVDVAYVLNHIIVVAHK